MIVAASGRLTPTSGDPSQWQIEANLPETVVVHIEVGQEVECVADAFPGHPFKAKVVRIDEAPTPGQERAAYDAVVHVGTPGLNLRRGMSVMLAFIIADRPNALRVPCQALWFHMPGSPADSKDLRFGLSPSELAMPDAAERAARTVWVLRKRNRPEPVRIRIGITDGTLTEVVAGLSEGERVVIGRTSRDAATPPADSPANRTAEPSPSTSSAGVRTLDLESEPRLNVATKG